MKKILPLMLPVMALAAGIAGGAMMRPAEISAVAAEHAGPSSTAEDATSTAAETPHPEASNAEISGGGSGEAWFTFPSQFFVPMMRNGDMGAIMILTLSIETGSDALEAMKQQEHRLRDALLRQLMIHANSGGFDGNFTSEPSMRVLRDRLSSAARAATSLPVRQVLIEDIARQGG